MVRKLNQLQRLLPEGFLADAAWLERQGYSRALRSQYVKSGWLDLVMRSVYRRPDPSATPGSTGWRQVVLSLQTILACPVWVGGRSALELQGLSHYLSPNGPQEIHLYGAARPPAWVFRIEAGARFDFHTEHRLFDDDRPSWNLGTLTTKPKEGEKTLPEGLMRISSGHREWPLIVSTPERAILELLDRVPRAETFHQADMLMEGLRSLSPRRLSKLLRGCRSVKVKRLFLWFAERHDQPWLKALPTEDIDLGSGKRMLARGGRLDGKYNITVPEHMDGGH